MTSHLFKKSIALCVVTVPLLLTGCMSPVFKTEYEYQQPLDPSGQACIKYCESDKMYCEQRTDQDIEDCKVQVELKGNIDYKNYEDKKNILQSVPQDRKTKAELDKMVKTKDDFYDYASCDLDTVPCDTAYNQCYVKCGGKIAPKTTCVAHCPDNEK